MSHPTGIRVIDNPETLRLIADPLRLRLLELLRRRPRTVTELADELELPRTNLYYHVKLLQSHGLVEVEETRVVSGITEKRFRATAFRLSVQKTLLGGQEGRTPFDVYVSLVLDEVAAEIRRAVDSGLIDLDDTDANSVEPRRLAMGRAWFHLTDSQVDAFRIALDALYDQFAHQRAMDMDESCHQGTDTLDSNAPLYEFLMAFYPIVPPGDIGND